MGGIIDHEPGAGQVQDQTTGPGGTRYIKIAVPNFRGDGNAMGSYLRIGGTEPGVNPGVPNTLKNGLDPTGEDLASLVTTPDSASPSGTSSFSDDDRDRGDLPGDTPLAQQFPPAAPESVPVGSPATSLSDESSLGVLHGKGGWRDHTDGNRITTTRGDKIEVIRGNYKMIILGRQDLGTDPKGDFFFDEWATGIDESGGLADNQDQSRSVNGVLDVSYTWQQNSDGRWGWTQVTRTGAFDTKAKRTTQGNGKQVTFTWVDEIWTYIGSPEPVSSTDPKTKPVILPIDDTQVPRPVKKMFSETWAETIVQTVNAVSISGGPISWSDDGSIVVEGTAPDPDSQPAVAPSIQTTTVCAGDITNVSRSFGKTENTTQAAHKLVNHVNCGGGIENHTTCTAAIYETTTCRSAHATFDMAPILFNMAFAAIMTEIKTLIHLDIHPGLHFDWHVGEHFDWHVGQHFQITNLTTEVSLDHEKMQAFVNEVMGMKVTVGAALTHLADAVEFG